MKKVTTTVGMIAASFAVSGVAATDSAASVDPVESGIVVKPSDEAIRVIGAKVKLLNNDNIRVTESFVKFPDTFHSADHGFQNFSEGKKRPTLPRDRLRRLKQMQLEQRNQKQQLALSLDKADPRASVSEVQTRFDEFKPK